MISDPKYIGEEVSVLYKDSTNKCIRYQPDDNDTIYGVVVTGNTSVVNATVMTSTEIIIRPESLYQRHFL